MIPLTSNQHLSNIIHIIRNSFNIMVAFGKQVTS